MKKYLKAIVGVVAVCLLFSIVGDVMAADANQPKTHRETPNEKAKDVKLVIGIVSMTKDNDGNITEIKVTTHPEIIYRVVLDEKGIDLGKTMVDKRARIEGTIEKKGDVEWLTVKTFGEPRAGAPAKPGQNPKAKPAKPAPKPAQKPAPKSK
jgi:hypothetical protein